MALTSPISRRLDGARVLVVDDEAMIALDIEMTLMDAGAEVSGPFGTVAGALEAAAKDDLSAALLDIRLGALSSEDIAAILAERGVPFCFYSGQELPETVRERWPDSRVISKPAQPDVIVNAIVALIESER